MHRFLLAGGCLVLLAVAGIALAWSAAPPASSPAPNGLQAWDAAEKQAHLDERCRTHCRNRGTSPELCASLCACTMDALFSSRSDDELQRLTAEGPYGRLSRQANQLLGEYAAQCAEAERAARVGAEPPAS